ncbi:hypothetical protein [Nonomuraea rhizosphaerae]|uniref:hypothetical protein n=1 Tax=Nonomuraea rhizosphaerae TaxID=2665663 RepID=UPI001C5D533D|nr:hypothetical protein [Nonomuraea rhizosphaerae]
MAEQQEHPRFSESITVVGQAAGTYNGKPAAQDAVRRAWLKDPDGMVLGHVWTDGQDAAGFVKNADAGRPAIAAAAQVWGILKDAHDAGRPAADVLAPSLYAPEFELVVD